MTTNVQPPTWVNAHHPTPAGKPPVTEVGVIGWLRTNLFSGLGNTIMTLLTLAALYWIISGLGR
jgi:general L-amino acid transport system permease protein